MHTRVDTIVEHPNFAVRHHIVDKTDVYGLPPAVGIAQARIDHWGCDLRLADAASMRQSRCGGTKQRGCA